MSACVDLMSSNVSVNKEVMKLCARVLEYDLQLWMLYAGAAPARTQGKSGVYVKRKDGGTRLCIPNDENDKFFSCCAFS